MKYAERLHLEAIVLRQCDDEGVSAVRALCAELDAAHKQLGVLRELLSHRPESDCARRVWAALGDSEVKK